MVRGAGTLSRPKLGIWGGLFGPNFCLDRQCIGSSSLLMRVSRLPGAALVFFWGESISVNVMITIEKLKEYEQYGGYYDGFYQQKVAKGINVTSGAEWSLISSLAQDIRWVQRALASKEFAERLHTSLMENCDNQDTIDYFITIATKGY
jgi:hypothetical protein